MEEATDPTHPNDRQVALGAAIKRFRADRTQAQFGRQLGVPQTTVSRWEAGQVDLGLEQLRDLEEALGVPFGTLARASGYIEPCPSLDEEETAFRWDFFDSFKEAKKDMKAAVALGIGVKMFNQWKPAGDNSSREEWVVVLSADAPTR